MIKLQQHQKTVYAMYAKELQALASERENLKRKLQYLGMEENRMQAELSTITDEIVQAHNQDQSKTWELAGGGEYLKEKDNG